MTSAAANPLVPAPGGSAEQSALCGGQSPHPARPPPGPPPELRATPPSRQPCNVFQAAQPLPEPGARLASPGGAPWASQGPPLGLPGGGIRRRPEPVPAEEARGQEASVVLAVGAGQVLSPDNLTLSGAIWSGKYYYLWWWGYCYCCRCCCHYPHFYGSEGESLEMKSGLLDWILALPPTGCGIWVSSPLISEQQ